MADLRDAELIRTILNEKAKLILERRNALAIGGYSRRLVWATWGLVASLSRLSPSGSCS